MSNGVQSFLAATVIALFGLIPLGLMAMGSSGTAPPTGETASTHPPGLGTMPEDSSSAAEASTRTVVTTPTPEISGVTDPVAQVLAAGGFATTESIDGVPDSIMRVLMEHGAVLTVAVGEGG